MGVLSRQFEATVSALSQAIAVDLRAAEDPAPFVLSQHRQLVDYLRPPMFAATLVFDWWGLIRRGRPFHLQDLENRSAQIRSWRNSSIAPLRDFIRFHELLALLRVYSEGCE